VKIIYIETKAGKTLGLTNKLASVVREREIEVNINSIEEETLVTYDLFYKHTEKFLKLWEKRASQNKNIVFIHKPRLIINKLLSKIQKTKLDDMSGYKNTIALILNPSTSTSNKSIQMIRDKSSIEIIEYRVSEEEYFKLLLNKLPKPLVMLFMEPLRITKFAIVGLTGFLVNLATIYLAYWLLIKFYSREFTAFLSSIISFETSLTWNFILHEIWTFKDLELKRNITARFHRWSKYHVGSIGSFLAQVSVVTLLTGFLGLPLYLSLFIGVTLGLSINYLLGRFYAWKK